MRRNAITLTVGLLGAIRAKTNSDSDYVAAVRSIMGHEMSHLVNKDFLPGLLIRANESANKIINKIVKVIFIFLANIFRWIPFIGTLMNNIIISAYRFISFFLSIFYSYVFMPIHNFIQKTMSRSIEYRCDRESSYAFGGIHMAEALSVLGNANYFSIFSTHPKTKTRIKHVKGIHPRAGIIRPNIFNSLSTVIVLAIIIGFSHYAYKVVQPEDLFNKIENRIIEPYQGKFLYFYDKVVGILG